MMHLYSPHLRGYATEATSDATLELALLVASGLTYEQAEEQLEAEGR